MLVVDFGGSSSLGKNVDIEAQNLTELAERLILHPGDLAETLATDAARGNAALLDGEGGHDAVTRSRSIALLVEAAAVLTMAAKATG